MHGACTAESLREVLREESRRKHASRDRAQAREDSSMRSSGEIHQEGQGMQEKSMGESRGDAEEVLRNIVNEHDRRSCWVTARQVVEMAREHPEIARRASALLPDLERLLYLHERSVRHEYLHEVCKQGVLLERHVFANKLREVEECGERCEWGRAYGGEEEKALSQVRRMLRMGASTSTSTDV